MKKHNTTIKLFTVILTLIFNVACSEDNATSEQENSVELEISVIGEGTTTPQSGTHQYETNELVEILAIPGNGAEFISWSGAQTNDENPLLITMSSNKNITANFSVTTELPESCDEICNAVTPSQPIILENGGNGNITMYTTEASSAGACNYGDTDIMYFAAMSVDVVPGDNNSQWQDGAICGQCAEVTTLTTEGPKTVVVRIMDKCPDENCGIDLGGDAPSEVMTEGFGRYQGEWNFVSCTGNSELFDGEPSLNVFSGSNEWWSRVNVHNGNSAVESITWQNEDGTLNGELLYSVDPENTYEVPTSLMSLEESAIILTVHYSDGTSAQTTVAPMELSVASTHLLE